MNVNFEYYKVFYHVCAHGSLTAAARSLYLPPAVSQAVRQLEKEAGTKLFFRTSKGVQLTREGELLYHYVKPGVEELLEGGKMLERMLNMDVGEVRIGASDMTLQFYLLPYLEQFHREYPKIKVNVTNAPTPETIKSLEEGRIDFGVVTSPLYQQRDCQTVSGQGHTQCFHSGQQLPGIGRAQAGVQGAGGLSVYSAGKEHKHQNLYGRLSGTAGNTA